MPKEKISKALLKRLKHTRSSTLYGQSVVAFISYTFTGIVSAQTTLILLSTVFTFGICSLYQIDVYRRKETPKTRKLLNLSENHQDPPINTSVFN